MANNVGIEVSRLSGTNPFVFAVTVFESGTRSQHEVTMSPDWAARFAQEPERLVEASFRFLLDRESKESILSRFDISVIVSYFPEFLREMPRYLARA